MLAALLEWFLWIGAFMYCLWKVFRKSEHWTVNVLAVLISIGFLLLRCVLLHTNSSLYLHTSRLF